MKVRIVTRSGKDLVPGGVAVSEQATVEELKLSLYKAKPHLYPARQRLTLPPPEGQRKPQVLESGKRLSDYAVTGTSVITLKDLGTQIGYSTVFFWEYFGPILVYLGFYFLPEYIYPSHRTQQKGQVQQLACAYWTFHYVKRILETFFLHKFSHGTMPIFNLFKNCAYYWGFAAFVAYFINHPLYTAPPLSRAQPLLLFAMLCQLSNFWCHIILAKLRSGSSSTGYQIPHGFLFEYITCANYYCEILGWVAFTAAVQTVAAGIFITAGAGQMAIWAKAKHARLRKIFDGKDGKPKYPRRWIMLPPLF